MFPIGCIGKLDMDVCVVCAVWDVTSAFWIDHHPYKPADSWMDEWIVQLMDWWIQVVVVVWHILKS